MNPESPDVEPQDRQSSAEARPPQLASEIPHPETKTSSTSAKPKGWFKKAQDWAYYEFRKIISAWVFVVVLVTIVGIGVMTTDLTDYTFSHEVFCSNVCHAMDNVHQELQKSKHWTTPTGVRATCSDCHVSRRLTFAMLDHFVSTGELFVALTNDFSKPGSFEKFRPDAADRARFQFFESDSKNCRECHAMEAIKPSRVRGQNVHEAAIRDGTTNCIVCHYNLVHKKVELSKAFQAAIEEYRGSTTEEPAGQEEPASDVSEGGEEVL